MVIFKVVQILKSISWIVYNMMTKNMLIFIVGIYVNATQIHCGLIVDVSSVMRTVQCSSLEASFGVKGKGYDPVLLKKALKF